MYAAILAFGIGMTAASAPAIGYCPASGGCSEYIARVQIGMIDNASGCSGYADNSHLVSPVAIGDGYALIVTNGFPFFDSDKCSVWVDWDQNGIFEDSGPECGGDIAGRGPYSFMVTVPEDAPAGYTRLRVRITDSTPDPVPCGASSYGEVEDYTLLVASCCVAHPWMGCDDAACQEAVCAFDRYCCENDWDDYCADYALSVAVCDCGIFGACCAPDNSCTLHAELYCLAELGGIWLGADTSCDPNPCQGACCDGVFCSMTIEALCTGEWLGSGTDCEPNPCEGACLARGDANCDGNVDTFDIDGFVVALTDAAQWSDTHSCDYLCANDVNCDFSVTSFDIDPFVQCLVGACPDCPSGACCLPDGGCQVVRHAECTTLGGDYEGDGTDCDPNPCP